LKPSVGKEHKDDIKWFVRSLFMDRISAGKMISKQYGYRTGKRFEDMMRRGQIAKARELCNSIDIRSSHQRKKVIPIYEKDMAKIHKRARKRRGREDNIYVVKTQKAINAFIRSKQATVGSIKRPWYDIFKLLGGTRGIPAYVKKSLGAKGRVKFVSSKRTDKPYVEMYSDSVRAGGVNYRRA